MPYHVITKDNTTTPMELVVGVLIDFFDYSEQDAVKKTMDIHNYNGLLHVIATYDDYDEAMQKVNDAMLFIKNNNDELQIFVR